MGSGSPHNLGAILTQSGWVGWGTVLLLLLMSVVSWSIIVLKTWKVLRLRQLAKHAVGMFWYQPSIEAGIAVLTPADNPFRVLVEEGVNVIQHYRCHAKMLCATINLNDWMKSNLQHAVENSQQKMQSGVSVLASIGTTAPFIGLFGTVWGIYHALINLARSGQMTSMSQVAGPVGEALVMTAFGLVVAVPAVLGFNALSRAHRSVLSQLHRFSNDLHSYFMGQAALASDDSV